MRLSEICARNVVTAASDMPLTKVATLMREQHVGCLIVINTAKQPIGIFTDRDLVTEVLAVGLDPDSLRIGDVMNSELLTAKENEDLSSALKRMRDRGVRRLPLVNNNGELTGLVSTDNILETLSDTLDSLNQLIKTEQKYETQHRK